MFINFWYAAARSDQLTDNPLLVRMLGQDFVLFRDAAGRAACLSNVCVHRGGSLAGGRVREACIECPYHGWRFTADGLCTRIPSLGADARVPVRARVDAYPVAERYGLVHVFLGDLPESERPPIMAVPEFGEPGWRATYQDYEIEQDYRRSLENALDPAHNEFVHPTHGFSGARDDYYVPELDVQDTPWGSGFVTTYFAPPLKDERMKAATGRSDNAVIHAGTFHHGPSCLMTRIEPTRKTSILQYGFKTPIDEANTRTFLVQMRNFLIEPEHDGRFLERNDVVRNQDIEVLAGVQPPIAADHPRELLMPADRAIGRYREKLREWQAQGWRIDVGALEAGRRREARVIPSPARRAAPRGWVLDAVPLMPASAAAGLAEAGAAS